MATLAVLLAMLWLGGATAHAQTFRFNLRAEPDIIPANGISTSAILVQVQNYGNAGITAAPVVRFITTSGSIEPQARLTGGVARVLLRSSNTVGTAIVTAFIGTAREQVTVEFSGDNLGLARYLVVDAPYVAYGPDSGIITASGKAAFEFGETHIESDVRLDVDLLNERIWAEGGAGHVLIRQGHGAKAHELTGDRLYYDMRRRRGVIRRIDTTTGAARQEFMDSDFKPIPASTGKAVDPDEGDFKTLPARHKSAALPPATLPPASAPKWGGRPPASAANSSAAITAVEPGPGTLAPDHSAAITPVFIEPVSDERPTAGLLKTTALATDGTSARPEANPTPATSAPGIAPAGAKPGVRTALNEGGAGGDKTPAAVPDYDTIPPEDPEVKKNYHITELPPPQVNNMRGYWIVSHETRVFPHDKIQFQHATVFYAGHKLFAMPLYVASLKTVFNPAHDMASLNSYGGLTLNVPYVYQASPRGTGSVFFQNAPSHGFAAEKPGLALALSQEYFLSNRSQGQLFVDQIGKGAWNLNWQHKMQFSPTMNGELFLDMPQHRNQFVRTSLLKEFPTMQVGFEGFYTKPDGLQDNSQGQFFARLRPRPVGSSQWTYTLAANLIAIRRWSNLVPATAVTGGTGGSGSGGSGTGGVGLPGRRSLTFTERAALDAFTNPYAVVAAGGRPVLGQTMTASFQAPGYNLWHGASLQAALLGTAYNYSNGQRGAAPGLTLGVQQNLGRMASLQLNYNYQRGTLSLNGAEYTNFLSGSMQYTLTKKLGGSAFFSKSLEDGSLYGMSTLDYAIAPGWRVGLFTDYARFSSVGDFLNYGWSLGRMIGQREVTLNWDHDRGRVYFELGGFRY